MKSLQHALSRHVYNRSLFVKNTTITLDKQLFSFAKGETDGTEGMVPQVPRDHQGY